MSNAGLVTTIIWHDRTYLVKLNALNNYLEISVVDQQSGEEWQCNYDNLCTLFETLLKYIFYIIFRFADVENLTHKTGNFKPFDTFIAMLKAGLLKTRSCVHLDLLTYEDLESLRIRRFQTHANIQNSRGKNCNRRYLILKYNADFDRINYPLPMEYCGPPDPQFLQSTIKRLESDLLKARNELNNKEDCNASIMAVQQRTERLENENHELRLQLRYQAHRSPSSKTLQNALSQLERIVQSERKSHLKLVEQMRFEKVQLLKTIDRLKVSETSLKSQLNQFHNTKRFVCGDSSFGSKRTLKTLYRRSRSLSQDSNRNELNMFQSSPNSSTILQKKGPSRTTKKKRNRQDIKDLSTSSLCSSINNATNRPVKHISRNSSRCSSKGSKHYSTASSESPCRPYDLKQSKPTKNKIRVPNPSMASIKQDKYDFIDLEKKVSSLQKMLNTKRR